VNTAVNLLVPSKLTNFLTGCATIIFSIITMLHEFILFKIFLITSIHDLQAHNNGTHKHTKAPVCWEHEQKALRGKHICNLYMLAQTINSPIVNPIPNGFFEDYMFQNEGFGHLCTKSINISMKHISNPLSVKSMHILCITLVNCCVIPIL
jgi:hypothetical protein